MTTSVAEYERVPAIRNERDRVIRWLAFGAAILSVGAFIVFYSQGTLLAYKDAVSHLEIARRVIDSPTDGLAQLGGVWLPLPHLLALPLVWFSPFYFSGFAASAVSMTAYVITTVLLYKIVYDLTARKSAGLIGALVFALNPNVLYMQATAMTELPLFACMAGMVYGVQRWIKTDRYLYLVGAGLAGLAGTLTRYEAWVLFAALTLVVGLTVWRKRYGYGKSEDTLLAFLLFAGAGIVGWLLWNLLIFGNPISFAIGEYAKPSLWVGSNEPSVGDLWTAILTYWYAIEGNLQLVIVLLAVAGLAVFILRERLADYTWPVLSLLVMVPFFVLALYTGQRPLHVEQISSDLYNVRFGLLMVLPAAVMIGYITTTFRAVWARVAIHSGVGLVLAGVMMYPLLDQDGVVTLKEPAIAKSVGYARASEEVSGFLAEEYDGGVILMESFGNELVLFEAGITTGPNLYEGSYQLWEPALANPAESDVHWIIMRGGDQPDRVYRELSGSDIDGYVSVFSSDLYEVYEREER